MTEKVTLGGFEPEAVESSVSAVDREDRSSDVSLGHPSVPLQDDDLGPDLVVNVLPLAQQLLDVVLESKRLV